MTEDNITIQNFSNVFVSTMDEILQKLYELPCTYIFVIMAAITFVLHIISLKKWFDDRVKNKKLLERMQSLAERNQLLKLITLI